MLEKYITIIVDSWNTADTQEGIRIENYTPHLLKFTAEIIPPLKKPVYYTTISEETKKLIHHD